MEKVKLYDFQKSILQASKNRTRVAYYLDMGLGKTFVGSEKLKQLGCYKNLVICQKSKVEDWIKHFKTYYAEYEVLDFTRENDLSKITTQERIIAIINYDLLTRRTLDSYFNKYYFTLLLDESSLIQNHRAKRTKYILQRLRPSNVVMLSGTPVGGKYENLWSQLRLLGYSQPYFFFFERYVEYYELKKKIPKIKIPIGYKNTDELKKLLKIAGCYFLKTSEVLELPQQNFINVDIEKPPYFDEFKKNSIVDFLFDGAPIKIVGDNTLNKLLGFRKLCGVYNKAKWDAFNDLIASSQSRFIVFYNYNAELEIIKSLCEYMQRPYSIVNGNIKDLQAYENKENSITMIQYQAGAMGLNLQKSNKIIYWSPTYSSDLFEQSKKRIHRIGQTEPCFYYFLKSGFDYMIYRALEKKENYTNALFMHDLENIFLW
jgi:SNF2 family DNA or RNA helicase